MLMADPWSPNFSANFGFAFNDVNFSDRVLWIEIFPDEPISKSDPDDDINDSARNRKRRRSDQFGNATVPLTFCLTWVCVVRMCTGVHLGKRSACMFVCESFFLSLTYQFLPCGIKYFMGIVTNYYSTRGQSEEEILKCNILDLENGAIHENKENAAGVMIDESLLGAETTLNQSGLDTEESKEGSESMDCFAFNVKTVNISSPILAAKSPFFYKLFSNGMKESVERQVTLRIQASEEDAFMDMLNFMYSNTLRSATPTALLDVLMAADKYEVASCMGYCSKLLRDKPMTCESALRYLNLPTHILMADPVLPLVEAANQFLVTCFKDINKFQEEVLNLPIVGIEAVLFSDYLQVASEDVVCDFVLKWARRHYPVLEERRQILSTRLLRFVRFPCMTSRKLRKVLTCIDIDPELASKVVLDALFFKAEAPYRQRALAAGETEVSFHRYVERAYRYRPVKVLEFEAPHQECIVYLELKREECAQLFPTGRVYSQAFHLAGQGFFLSGHCNMDQQNSFQCFGLFLGMQDKGGVSFKVDYDFASRMKPSWEFTSKYKGNYTFTGGKAVGYRNIFGVPWTAFIAEDSPYFINGTLYLKAELTIKK